MPIDLSKPNNKACSDGHLPAGTLTNEPAVSGPSFVARPQDWGLSNTSLPMEYPAPPQVGGVVQEIFGEQVADPWRILEDLEADESKRFIAEQNALSTPLLANHRLRNHIEAAVRQSYSHEQMSVPQLQADGWYYWSFNTGTSPRDILVRSKDLERDFGKAPDEDNQGPEVFFDLNDQKDISLYAHSFSPSGRLWAAVLQDSGSDWQTIRVYDTRTKQAVDTDLGGSKFTFGVTWVGEEGFIDKRIIHYDPVTGVPSNFSDGKFGMFYHRIGEPQSSDIGVLRFTDKFNGRFCGKAKIISVDQKPGSGKRAWLTFDLYRNTNPETELLVVELPGGTGAVNGRIIEDLVYNHAKFVTTGFTGETYYIGSMTTERHLFVSTAEGHSTGRIVSFDSSEWDGTPPGGTVRLKEVVPVHEEGYQLNILSATLVGDKLIVLVYLKHACASVVFVNAWTGRPLGSADAYGTRGDVELDPETQVPVPKEELRLAKKGTVIIPEHGQIKTLSARSDTDDFYFAVDTFVAPPYVLRGQVIVNPELPDGLEVEISSINEPQSAPQETLVCSQVFYDSHDGEKIPMFICHSHDLDLTKPHPALLHGYGGYASPILPHFDPFFATFMRNLRGVVAIAGIRGGGEYGKRWHDAATGAKRWVAWDDFAFAAKHLQAKGFTTPEMTAIYGSSNGGLLVSACMNRHPELYRTVFADVPVTDLLRYHLFTHGSMWLAEFGSPDDPKAFPILFRTSPLHNVASNKTYPSVLMTTADNDNRVIPGHGLKLLAELQSKMPRSTITGFKYEIQRNEQGQRQGLFLGKIYQNTGHEAGAKSLAKKVEETTDRLIFALLTMKPE